MRNEDKLIKTIYALQACNQLYKENHFINFSQKIIKPIYPFIMKYIWPAYNFFSSKASHQSNTIAYKTKHIPKKVAVVLHLFYVDLIDEYYDCLKNIPTPFSLFINSDENDHDFIRQEFSKLDCELFLDSFSNRGRDILPFLKSVKKYQLHTYDLVCKIHTKKSLHYSIGEAWRFALLNSILGTKERVINILSEFSSNPKAGLIGCQELIFDFPCDHINLKNFTFLKRHYDISLTETKYIAGTMFWIKGSLLQKLYDIPIEEDFFVVEMGDVDGNLDHAYERIFGALCKEKENEIIGFSANTL